MKMNWIDLILLIISTAVWHRKNAVTHVWIWVRGNAPMWVWDEKDFEGFLGIVTVGEFKAAYCGSFEGNSYFESEIYE